MSSPETPEPSLEERLGNLSPKQRAVVERKLLERSKAAGAADSEIVPQQGPGPWPLSPAQELMWLVQQLAENTALYNSSGARRLVGPLNVDALQRALDGVVARHEAMRTTFEVHDGTPVQVVHPPSSVAMPLRDVSDLPEEARNAALDELLRREVRTRFDLEKPLLIRAALLRLGEDDHVLVTVANHIVWDGWSKGVFFRELAEFYDAFSTGREPDLPELPVQYRDYAVWQQGERASERGRSQLAYWKEKLTGAPSLLDLPTDHPRPAEQTFEGNRQSLWMDGELLDALKALSRAQGATLFMTLLSAWYVLLHRFSGQDDIVVGTPIAGRNRTEIEGLIGYFTNTLALRTSCAGDPTFAQLLQRVRDTSLDAFANQDVSLEYVVREVAPARSLSHSSLFQSLFVVQNATSERLELPGIKMEGLDTDPGSAKFDLSLGIGEHHGRLHASFEYATDLFDAETIARLSGHFHSILREIVANPDQPISTIALVDDEEREKILAELTGPAFEVDTAACVHALVSAHASAAPDAVAVEWNGTSMSYGELDERSNRLANHLRGLGVGPGTLVGIALDHRPELVTGLLGIMKAGGACVPLDPEYPAERLALMLDDAAPAVLVTTRDLVERLPNFTGSTVFIRADWPKIAEQPATAPEAGVDGSALAYVLYTSGSTGKPKGVLLEHRGLVNHAQAAADLYRLTRADRMLQFCSISFDISVEEIFSTLAAGATLVLRDDSMAVGGRGFLDWLDRNRISVVDLPTAFWHEWVRDLEGLAAVPPASLRQVIVGGEKAQVGTLATWQRLVGDRVAWINTYGPTEASVVATAWEPPAGSRPLNGERLPIGRPIRNVTVRLLDANRQPVPTGFRGEIYLGGTGVARGYLRQPEQTAASFVDDPWNPGQRLYRTGDVARLRADGTLEFVGRTDHQVKIRGFRVELSEVEAAVLGHRDIAEAAIVVREGPAHAQVLVAYAVPRRGVKITSADVRSFLSRQLPAFMVPATVVMLDELPLTQNGKVDTAALPSPTIPKSEASATPQDDVERRLHALVCSTLDIAQIGVHDDLFDAGFHSLLAVRFFAGVERAFDVTLPLSALIQHPTIAGLADVIRDRARSTDFDALVPLRSGGTRPPLFCVHGATGDVILYMNLVRSLPENQPAYGIQCVGMDGRRPQHTRFEDMAASYVREIVEVQPEGPYFLTGYCLGGVVAFEIARQLRETGRSVAMIGLIDSMPFGRFESTTKTVRYRLKHNARRVGQLATPEIFPFLKTKVTNLWNRLYRPLWWKAMQRLFLDRGKPIPRRLRNFEQSNLVIARSYITPDYDGQVDLFQTTSDPAGALQRRHAWEELAGGGVSVRNLVADGIDHVNLMTEPYVHALADAMSEAIDEILESGGASR